MGNTGSTISAKNWDASRMPTVQNSAGASLPPERAVIFNADVAEVSCFPAGSVVSLSLVATGYKTQTVQTTTAGRAGHGTSMLQKGFTFALDKYCLESAVLMLKVVSGNQTLAERAIPVKTLKYSGQKFFNETISFGMLAGEAKNHTSVPTVKMAFELLSVGDGKIHEAKQPHFMQLELAQAGAGGMMQSHPLGMVR